MTKRSTRKIARCFTDDEDNEYSVAYFDGYHVGDRLWEGVTFRAELNDGFLTVSLMPYDRDYMAKFNEDNYLTAALKYAEQNDVFMYDERLSDKELFFKQ